MATGFCSFITGNSAEGANGEAGPCRINGGSASPYKLPDALPKAGTSFGTGTRPTRTGVYQ